MMKMYARRKSPSIIALRAEAKTSYGTTIWIAALTLTLLSGYLTCLNGTWLQAEPSLELQAAMAIFTILCCAVAHLSAKKQKAANLLFFLPFPVLFMLTNTKGYIIGAKTWISMIFSQWSAFYEGSSQVVSFSISETDILSFALLTATVLAELVWFLTAKRKIIISGSVAFFILFLQLMTGNINVLGSAAMIVAMIGLVLSEKDMRICPKGILWVFGFGITLCVCLLLIPNVQLKSIDILRQDTQEAVHLLRYGEDSLPEGDLRAAATLHADKETEMLQVSSAQKKNMYLRAFVGGIYRQGQWNPMPKSTYKNEHTGMLTWLKERDFDPLTQSAKYHALDNAHEAPELNEVSIHVSGASRCYLYTPSSLENFSSAFSAIVKNVDDTRVMSKGFLGRKNYKFSESSGIKPSELTVASEWLNSPQTAEENQYVESEAVYRDFVYEHYTTADSPIYHEIQALFWEDYETENEGIFNAIEQIRSKLRQYLTYADVPKSAPSGEDPILWALTSSHEGNAVIYASAAAEALRVYGIPVRYIEGYYIPASYFQEENGGSVSLAGDDAHAWIEVYFDGIGWLPLDVTPGYYYDTLSLQNLVSAPNSAPKTATLNDNAFEGTEIADTEGSSEGKDNSKIFNIHNLSFLLMGILGLLVISISLIIAAAELLRLLKILQGKRQYELANSCERVYINRKRIYYLLSLWNIDAGLGWKTKEVDHQVYAIVPGVAEGEYARVCEIIEKTIYGQLPPENYEEHTVLAFLRKLYTVNRSYPLRKRLQLRYANLHF